MVYQYTIKVEYIQYKHKCFQKYDKCLAMPQTSSLQITLSLKSYSVCKVLCRIQHFSNTKITQSHLFMRREGILLFNWLFLSIRSIQRTLTLSYKGIYPSVLQENILCLEISMQNLLIMQIVQSQSHLSKPIKDLL